MRTHARHLSTRAQKVEWLRAHPAVLLGRDDGVADALKAAGLAARTTLIRDLRVPLLRALVAAPASHPVPEMLRGGADYFPPGAPPVPAPPAPPLPVTFREDAVGGSGDG